MPENMERLQFIAQQRYGQDLQGACKRMQLLNGLPEAAANDFEGLCRASNVWPPWTASNFATIEFSLLTSPAP